MSSLSEFYIKKAEEELGETESRKQQSIEQFKDWLKKHPFINVKSEEIEGKFKLFDFFKSDHARNFQIILDFILLGFLRVKKYQMSKAFDCFEKTMIYVKTHPEWFNFQGESLERALELYEDGYVTVMKERDVDGRRIISVANKNIKEKFSGDDVLLLHTLAFTTISLEAETQIAGISYINSFQDAPSNFFGLFSLKSVFDFSSSVRNLPFRMKKIIFIGLPQIASQFFKVIRMAMSDSINERVQILSDVNELSKVIDISLLTRELGGKHSQTEAIDWMREKIKETAKIMTKHFQSVEVDIEKAEMLGGSKDENIGSFRTLEID